jgi:hypothetical protein
MQYRRLKRMQPRQQLEAAAKASGKAKLAALGLTAEEIEALTK